ncbi:UDP-galactopyranose mutase [uncultured Brachyspira sp.]|uniref:UDP-galactopyranose mutase n=1 Tax=uncultured Brachyspira sp. TaxID=221953 RepID=UPI0027DE3059|nr:UDP-galactopyranose mutase [uncultured Brachyspira sp.]
MYLIVGAGISGSVLANLIAERLDKKVLIIDRGEHIAGNCFDYLNVNENITVHKYGPHIFHTNNKEVWDYLSNFTKWHYFYLKPNVMIEGNRVSLPFTLKTLRELFSFSMSERIENKLIAKYGYGVKVPILDFQKSKDKDLNFIGKFVYENVFKNYTIKQWGLKPEEIDASVTARVPIYISNDSRYFQDKYQAIPIKGYTKLIENILNHKNITVQLNTDYKTLSQNEIKEFKTIFYTGAIDEYFNYQYGELTYRILKFDIMTIDKEYYQKSVVTNYPNDYDFTRITEHKYFLDEKSNKTIISLEYPRAFSFCKNERYYPINNDKNDKIYNKYLRESKKLNNVYFFGRLGDYKYYNMDLAVERVFELFEKLKNSLLQVNKIKK